MFAGVAGVSDTVARDGVAVTVAEELGSEVDISDGGRESVNLTFKIFFGETVKTKKKSFKFGLFIYREAPFKYIARNLLFNGRVYGIWADLGLRVLM